MSGGIWGWVTDKALFSATVQEKRLMFWGVFGIGTHTHSVHSKQAWKPITLHIISSCREQRGMFLPHLPVSGSGCPAIPHHAGAWIIHTLITQQQTQCGDQNPARGWFDFPDPWATVTPCTYFTDRCVIPGTVNRGWLSSVYLQLTKEWVYWPYSPGIKIYNTSTMHFYTLKNLMTKVCNHLPEALLFFVPPHLV